MTIKCESIESVVGTRDRDILIEVSSLDTYHLYMNNDYEKLLDCVPTEELLEYIRKREADEL